MAKRNTLRTVITPSSSLLSAAPRVYRLVHWPPRSAEVPTGYTQQHIGGSVTITPVEPLVVSAATPVTRSADEFSSLVSSPTPPPSSPRSTDSDDDYDDDDSDSYNDETVIDSNYVPPNPSVANFLYGATDSYEALYTSLDEKFIADMQSQLLTSYVPPAELMTVGEVLALMDAQTVTV